MTTRDTKSRVVGAHLYVMQAASGEVKIGRSSNPKQRARDLQNARGERVAIIKVCRDRGGEERSIHDALSLHRKIGEWFRDGREFREKLSDLIGMPLEFRGKAEVDAKARIECEAAVANVVARIQAEGARRRARKEAKLAASICPL